MLGIPGYRVVTELYESENSLVYRGYRLTDYQPLVFKILKEDHPTPYALTRYQQEYEITRSLHLDGVIKTYGLQPYHNTLVMLLEDFGGESLQHWLQERALTLAEGLTLGIRIVEILEQVHQHQILHKDINPSNLVWNPQTQELKLIDFGIASQITREMPAIRSPNLLEGTLAYMSPEQTGRMNRAIDYRSDFYALGATLYELLTRQLPFTADDALELVHCHLAKRPVAPSERSPAIPKPVSDLVMKLLEKNAEDRYQSCRGIQADLTICLTQLQTTHALSSFPLAQQDISDRFQIPQKLYGREREIETLLSAFEQIAGGGEGEEGEARKQRSKGAGENDVLLSSSVGHQSLTLISGYSGIGKTSLVQEIYKPITQRRGYFIAGKFDQYQRDLPYSAFVSAFAEWVEQVLTEPEAQLSRWRSQLLTALAPNTQVMVDVIPELEWIVGQQPPVPELPPTESRNRFIHVFQQFIQVLAQPAYPLAIFLDDLQWVDAASLQLIQVLMTAKVSCLFLIGAYRENEVSPAHPLMQAIAEIQQAGTTIQAIALSPLQKTDIQHLLADTLNCAVEEVALLADLVLAKTNGNPFFVNEFLWALYIEQLLTFDHQQGRWQWLITDIQQRNMTDNVVELLISKIQRLEQTTQDALRHAACIGNPFDLQMLTLMLQAAGVLPEPNAAAAIALLKEAVHLGLILPLNDSYKRIELGIAQSDDALRMEYKFAHDQIQQAVYSLIPVQDRSTYHWQIGQLLRKSLPSDKCKDRIFDIVNHLNAGIGISGHTYIVNHDVDVPPTKTLNGVAYLSEPEQRYELIHLNLLAGRRAKLSSAYNAASQYFQTGLALLPQDSWVDQYDLTLSLYTEAAEAAYLNAHFEQASHWIAIALNQAKTLLDTVKVYEIKIQVEMAQLELLQAIETGLHVIQLLNISLKQAPPEVTDVESLIDLPEMTDTQCLAVMGILTQLITPAYIADPALFSKILFTMMDLSLEYGNCSFSAYGYVLHALLLCGFFFKIDLGYRYGKLAIQLLEKYDNGRLKCKVYNVFYSNVKPWKQPVRAVIQPLIEATQSGFATGDFEFAGIAALNHCKHLLFLGEPLERVDQYLKQSIDVLTNLKQEFSGNWQRIRRQMVLNLLGQSEDPSQLVGVAFNATEMIPILLKNQNASLLFLVYLVKIILFYFCQKPELVPELAIAATQYEAAAAGMVDLVEFKQYHSLALLALYPQQEAHHQHNNLAIVAANQEKLKGWADHAPMNFLHKWYLVEAERYRVLGEAEQAVNAYERAATLAKEQGYIQEESLAHERTGLFYLEKGNVIVAKAYLQEARYGYLKWSAIAKVRDLEERYSLLSRPAGSARVSAAHPQISLTTTGSNHTRTLDLATVIKASQTLSGDLNLAKLLTQLMTLLLQNAGAQTGVLLLASHNQLRIEATGTVDPAEILVEQSIPLETTERLPIALIQYVARKQETVILEDASQEPRFAGDRYIQRHQPQSVLCTPIQGQGKLIGILYLENNLTTNAFTPDRATILQVLTAQAAIALENAQLYEQLAIKNQDLQQEVSDRRRAEESLRLTLAEREILLKEIHHRVRNNMEIISGLLQLQISNTTDPKTLDILKESQNRIDSMVLIHKKLSASANLGEIDLADYISNLATSLLTSYQFIPNTVTLELRIDPVTLNIDQATPCGLVVNELISNALKHAFPNGRIGVIQIDLHTVSNAQLELIIRDNGVGLPESIDLTSAQSLGLSLVRDLVIEQLEGTLVVERHPGTTFKIQFPQQSLWTARITV
jgi:predicted ATPase/two-component sensor histidine kinase